MGGNEVPSAHVHCGLDAGLTIKIAASNPNQPDCLGRHNCVKCCLAVCGGEMASLRNAICFGARLAKSSSPEFRHRKLCLPLVASILAPVCCTTREAFVVRGGARASFCRGLPRERCALTINQERQLDCYRDLSLSSHGWQIYHAGDHRRYPGREIYAMISHTVRAASAAPLSGAAPRLLARVQKVSANPYFYDTTFPPTIYTTPRTPNRLLSPLVGACHGVRGGCAVRAR